jgi:hypothetical protein
VSVGVHKTAIDATQPRPQWWHNEHDLLAALVTSAQLDLELPHRLAQPLHDVVVQWLISASRHEFGFLFTCDHLRLDPQATRVAVIVTCWECTVLFKMGQL